MDQNTDLEVKVTNAFKSYGASNNVLNGLDMNVRSGSIYGLLGPSGCGKSTLLQCILGKLSLDYGRIDLKVDTLNDVGYMPQDLCLDGMLTVWETFEYYGTLYNMNVKKIKSRVDELNTFLELPNMNSLVKDISGGQSRRVSLAVSILHDPKLIILDEPTVGIDPVVRSGIWNELSTMAVKHKKTIIVTTHYIEEANHSHCIGLMRNGILLGEGPPNDFLVEHDTDSLEAVFLTLCCNQEKGNKIVREVLTREKSEPKILESFGNNFGLFRVKALIKKNIRVCSRDYLLLFLAIGLPIWQAFNFGLAVGTNFKDMPIAVKNDEVDILNCRNYTYVSGCVFDEYRNQKLSCAVVNYLSSHRYKLVTVNDHRAGETSMKNPTYMAFLHFPENYTNDLIKYMDREDVNINSMVYVHLTKENFMFRNQMRSDLFKSMKHMVNVTLGGCSMNPKSNTLPLNVSAVYGSRLSSLGNSTVNQFIALIIFCFTSIFSSTMMLSEKLGGVISRSMFAGVKTRDILISFWCIDTVVITIQVISSCLISYTVFSNPIEITSGLFVFPLLLILLGWLGFLFGLISAIISPTHFFNGNVITGSFLAQILLSGFCWPVEGQPQFLQILSELIPIRIFGIILNGISIKGWAWNHPSIMFGFGVTFVYCLASILVLVILRKFKKDLWVVHK